MIVNLSYAVTKNFQKLVNKLFKTTLKLTKVGTKKLSVDISSVSSEEIMKLNAKFRNIEKPTDVLSFPTMNLKPFEKICLKMHKEDINPDTKHLSLGDIIICEEIAQKQAKEYGHSIEREMCYLIVHGYLHLLGYDHINEQDKIIMRGLEEQILSKYHIIRK